MTQLTQEQIDTLRAKIAEWRAVAELHGSMHPRWDSIFCAEALVRGETTILSGTPDEVYRKLMP